jgi:glutaminase
MAPASVRRTRILSMYFAVWSPGLNHRGNSKLGSEALEHLAAAMNWSVFTA